MATIDSLKEILNENLDIEPEKVVESATFDELGIDSLDMAEPVSYTHLDVYKRQTLFAPRLSVPGLACDRRVVMKGDRCG